MAHYRKRQSLKHAWTYRTRTRSEQRADRRIRFRRCGHERDSLKFRGGLGIEIVLIQLIVSEQIPSPSGKAWPELAEGVRVRALSTPSRLLLILDKQFHTTDL